MSTTTYLQTETGGVYTTQSRQLADVFNVDISADGCDVALLFVDRQSAIQFARDLLSKVMPDTLDEALESERTACEKATTADEFLDAYGRESPL